MGQVNSKESAEVPRCRLCARAEADMRSLLFDNGTDEGELDYICAQCFPLVARPLGVITSVEDAR
jgi:hypothetical protein